MDTEERAGVRKGCGDVGVDRKLEAGMKFVQDGGRNTVYVFTEGEEIPERISDTNRVVAYWATRIVNVDSSDKWEEGEKKRTSISRLFQEESS